MRAVTAAPDLGRLGGGAERLLTDLALLEDRLWLVIDDAHLLRALVGCCPSWSFWCCARPPQLRFVLVTRA